MSDIKQKNLLSESSNEKKDSDKDFYDELIELKPERKASEVRLDDWLTMEEAAALVGRNLRHTYRRAYELSESHPDWIIKKKSRKNHQDINFLAPELVAILVQENPAAPESWKVITEVSEETGISREDIVKTIKSKKIRDKNPNQFGRYPSGDKLEYYLSPDLVEVIELKSSQELSETKWWTMAEVEELVGKHVNTIKEMIKPYQVEHPEWFNVGHPLRVSDELVEVIVEKYLDYEPAPEGWKTFGELSESVGRNRSNIAPLRSQAEPYRSLHPEWFHNYSQKGILREYISPELVDILMSTDGAQVPMLKKEGWQTKRVVAERLGIGDGKLEKFLTKYRNESPNLIKKLSLGEQRSWEFLHPELIAQLETEVNQQRSNDLEVITTKEKQAKIQEGLIDLLIEVEQGQTVDGKQIRNLTELFGPESIVDILQFFNPEYEGLPMSKMRSIIPDYLGEFLRVRGELNLETLESGIEYIGNPNLKSSLLEVVKSECLKHYNLSKRVNPEAGDISLLAGYIEYLRQKTKNFSTPDLLEVFDEVENYYVSALNDIYIPESLVSELVDGRLFPDLNQRINIKEIVDKHKVLIADEMGVGKSASAILAKESLQIKQALVVAPSNVISTWQRYLSDEISEDGKQVGYFKPGHAPRVLVVSSPEVFTSDMGKYDYVLISQERLTDDYVSKLTNLQYGMLIVDESHKLKNIGEGKRAANLIRLAEQIQEGDKAKYLALLSGTPVPNNIGDVAMILKLLYPDRFEEIPNNELTNQIIKADVLNTRNLLVPRMEVKSLTESIEMPKLAETTHFIEMPKFQRDLYEALLEEDELTAQQKIHILRQFVLNPQMLDVTPNLVGIKNEEVGTKLRKAFVTKDKLVMFVNGYKTGVLRGDTTILENLHLPNDVQVLIIDGDNPRQRTEIQSRFQTTEEKVLLVVNGQTADVGVDFSAGQGVYFYNEPWTEYEKKQQLGRVFRYGLRHDLTSETFVTQGTIEAGIHTHIQAKFQAVEKLLRGIPLSEIEKQLVRQGEKQVALDLEVNPELAQDYLSSWGKMMAIFGHVKEIGEIEFFNNFLPKYGRDYANAYIDIGSRSYQANASRLSATVINNLIKASPTNNSRILDIASGPEMLRKHMPEEYANQVYSLDINRYHFEQHTNLSTVGSFLQLPIQSGSVDYTNLCLALHYTSFAPSRGDYQRLGVLQEMNRVLSPGGRAVMSLMYTLDLKDPTAFQGVIQKCGFKIDAELSGLVEVGDNFKTRVITLEKVDDCPHDLAELVRAIGNDTLNGLKFASQKTSLKDSRKIITHFTLGDKTTPIKFNEPDRKTVSEENSILTRMNELKKKYKSIENIPADEIVRQRMARIRIGKKHILFKQLESASGAVRLG